MYLNLFSSVSRFKLVLCSTLVKDKVVRRFHREQKDLEISRKIQKEQRIIVIPSYSYYKRIILATP